MPPVIEALGLTKQYPPAGFPLRLRRPQQTATPTTPSAPLAVDRTSFRVGAGEIFGLIGPNGAGKTTLVKMLATLILPTAGTATIRDIPITRSAQIKPHIGLMTHNERSFFPRLTCNENLTFYAGLAQLPPAVRRDRVRRLAGMLDFADQLDVRYDRCSTGMKHRLALARALLNDASVLLLDEPTATLDPVAAVQFRELLYGLVHQEARTVLMVTHNIDEAVELCDRVGVMVAGRLYDAGTPTQLRSLLHPEARCTLQVRGGSALLPDRLRRLEGVEALTLDETPADLSRYELALADRKGSLPRIVAAVASDGATLERLQLATATWDEVVEHLDTAPPDPASRHPAEAPWGPVHHQTTQRDAGHPPSRLPVPKLDLAARLRELASVVPLFLRRDLKTQTSYRLSFLLQLGGILLSITSYYFVGEVFGLQSSPLLASYGGDYFSFVLIGIALLGYQSVALYGFSHVVQSAQTTGTLEAMLATPTRLSAILVGSSAWDFLFTSLRVALYLLAGGLLFGAKLTGANWAGALLILLLTVACLSAIGILSASFIMVFKRGSPINFLISGVTLLLGGVYYPVEVLPAPLQTLARFYPLTISLEAMRRALLAGMPLQDLTGDLLRLAGFICLLTPLSLVSFSYAVNRAKRDGSLTQF